MSFCRRSHGPLYLPTKSSNTCRALEVPKSKTAQAGVKTAAWADIGFSPSPQRLSLWGGNSYLE